MRHQLNRGSAYHFVCDSKTTHAIDSLAPFLEKGDEGLGTRQNRTLKAFLSLWHLTNLFSIGGIFVEIRENKRGQVSFAAVV
jgi:hypothetical protein